MDNTYDIFGYNYVEIKKGGEVWSLKLEKGKLLGKTLRTSWQQLADNYSGNFAFAIDGKEIHLIFKTGWEEIKYCRWVQDTIESKTIQTGNPDEKKTCFKIILDNDKSINIFVLTENPLQKFWKIYFCQKNAAGWSMPEVIDDGHGFSQGQISIGVFQNLIYIVYQTYNDGHYHLVYRIRKENIWYEKQPILSSQGINLNPSLVIDKKGDFHLVWLNCTNFKFSIYYCQRFCTRGFWQRFGWSKKQLITTGEDSCLAPLLIIEDDQRKIFWQQKEEIFCCFLPSGGEKLEINSVEKIKKELNLTINLDSKQEINLSLLEKGSTALFMLMENSPSPIEPVTKNEEITINKRLKKINGNFRKMIFENDSLELMETLRAKIESQEQIIKELNNQLSGKEDLITKLQEKNAHLQMVNEELKGSLLKKGEEEAIKRDRANIISSEAEQEIDKLKRSLAAVEKINNTIRSKLAEREREIVSLLKIQSDMEEQLKKQSTPPFPFLRRK
ncbi:MAG: hypothetical protein ACOYVD_02665 [Bacillota bacterium]